MSKHKDGEYFKVYWSDDDPSYEGVHGHVGFDVFCEAMKREGLPGPASEADLEHVYFRCVPVSRNGCDGLYMQCRKGPGAFPVTVWRFVPFARAGGVK